ncbi:MAG: hypothetical protein HZB31_04235 [Nitrospirae bacterium]|nr:hypothetical protein [Nitrospirota bacterium]
MGNAMTDLSRSSSKAAISRIERGLFVALLFASAFLHVSVFTHSGGLWRDEINTLNISTFPSFTEIWDKMQFESFPMLWLLTLRSWVALGFGASDLSLRALGLIVGLGTLGAIWSATRSLAMRLPLLSLVFFSICPTAFFADSLRAYGLGVILILLTLGTVWRTIQEPTMRRMAVSLLFAVLSVQCQYNNAFLLLALCMGAVTVGIMRRDTKLIIFPLGIGVLSAASLLPYVYPIAKAGDWNVIYKNPITLSWIIDKFRQAADPAGGFLTWVWLLSLLLALIVFVRIVVSSSGNQSRDRINIVVYLLVTLVVGIISYIAFVKILAISTQGWNYLPLMAMMAVILDKAVDLVCENALGRTLRSVCIAGIAVSIALTSWDAAHVRRTNMDALASKLQSISATDDLVVIYPFYLGISFARYYKGSSTWITIPEIEDHSVHRYDLFKDRMVQSEPLKPAIEKMFMTLKNGNRVWLVGELDFLRPGEVPGDIPPAPYSPYGWSEGAYQLHWSQQAAFALQSHWQTVEQIPLPDLGQVNGFENISLIMIQGWRP